MSDVNVGDRFGRLTVMDTSLRVPRKDRPTGYKAALCLCDCGNQITIAHKSLKLNNTKSCGCLGRETWDAGRAVKHNLSESPEYHAHAKMIRRCSFPQDTSYQSYGGRGITVHPDWVGEGGFERFYAHIGPRPSNKYSLDRINNDGNYEPGNVRWATRVEQANNKRSNRRLSFNGETRTLQEWSRITGIQSRTLAHRIHSGWPIGEALTTPTEGGS